MSVGIKRSAIPASGYMYQTLVGIKLLCDWLDTPSLYDWVKFEADDEKDAQGLDDIVAQRIDGRVDLIQVKFTVDVFDPSNALSWSWLTTRKGQRGRSLLEKWSSAFFRVGLARLGAVRLITNRRPDAAFTLHLADVKVRWESLPEGLRQELEPHLGGAESAALFFENFEFSHSFAGYESLGGTVSSALEGNHTDHLGWLTLLRRATEWSIHKNAPAPDGRITLEVLRSTISERQPRPLDQEFRVPAGYLPPDPQFAKEFIDEIQSGDWNERVLWGSPGQGKSTFLSYICEQLRALGMQVVRHHYFLDLQDSSDRFSLKSVARSMMSQLLSDFPEQLLQDGGSTSRGTELLDPAFHLALRLQGPKPAFVWLVRAHQYRYGWSERHYGYSESIRRLELVGKHYPKRWKDFLARSSLPAPNSYVQERAIPDAGIVRLLLEVNDLERAKSVFETMIDIVVEEFSAQPLEQPEWWQEPGA